MHIDARNLENNSLIEGDICIVGAGAAGISMALDWLNTGRKVILLEGGGFEYDDRIQDLYSGKATGQRYFPLKSARLHYFGGTTGHWSGFCSTFDPIDFEKRDWIEGSGWPIVKDDIEPFYPTAHKYLDLGPYEYDWKYWQQQHPSLNPLPFDEKVVWNKIWQFSAPTRFGTKYKDTIVKSKNVHLYTYANVVDITADEAVSTVEYLTVKNHAGKRHRVKAKHFILACCSIQNARLLLAANKQTAKGIGNDHGHVGKYFMEHLEIKSAELWLSKPGRFKLYEYGDIRARAELAISSEMQRKHRILNGTVSLSPLALARKRKAIIDMWTDEDPRRSLDSLRAGFDSQPSTEGTDPNTTNAFELFTRIEQAPNPLSRVTLDSEKDSLGVPRGNLHWVLTPVEKRSIRKIYELVGQQIGLSGLGRVRMMDYLHDENDFSWPRSTGGGWHHMGTTRMTDDPKAGVVDRNCKVHSISNLYVAGASCFTTAAAVNPTLTLVALSLRLSDHLKGRLTGAS
jgi:choline dehydrogenase-like flavoprotein